ncbi:zinc finger and BTB domain-containing protein 17-like isoform X3 [Galleria mellonella]|uniref:Zinc finger and BTB domain-containing protein 17-like isoform X3 n=1 Tax=Galleria mellonella TaxID=7137 RepID=A0A6J1W9D7_GALME|nr:zinc finger and BTB domain-containing protein 17-like isoform X3 [Galleria mellonella]
MDIDNIKSWVSQPDVCRCCLSASGTWDMTASYVTESGVKEVYNDMLQDCYGITLSHLTQWGPSHLMCSLCASHLRDANTFREQVLQADKHFTAYWSRPEAFSDVPIKCEGASPHSDSAEPPYTDDESNITLNSYISPEKSKALRKREKSGVKSKRERKKISSDDDYDSDVPISLLVKDGDMGRLEGKKETDVRTKGQPQTNGTKLVSERKRVMLTCCAVLRDTTACPFRHHKSWFQCFFCSQDFMELNLLRTHTLATHADVEAELKKIKRYPRSLQIEISNLECRHCNLNLTDVDYMRRHLSEAHGKVIYRECIADYKVDASPYTCHLCKREFHVFRTLTTHLNEHYANCICDVCGKSFLNSKRLKVHKRTHESGQYPCGECGKILKTKTSKANHMESAHSKRQLKCQICFKPMKHYNDRIKHMSEAHNITHKFLCPFCGREYNIKHYLATHIRQTHGHKNKKCVECGMAFITNHGLKKHMLKHTGEKPFICNLCNKSYARSYTLKEHMRAHDNDTYTCPDPE